MRTVCVFFALFLPLVVQAQSYRVSQVKFDGFKAYEKYDIDLESIRSVLLAFSKKNPSFEQNGLFVLAAELAEVYRSKGLAFHRVDVVLGNPVRLVLVPGVMSSIDVRGNTRYKSSQITPFFENLTGRLVDNRTLQTAMTRMNSMPGLNGFAFLSFGQKPGEAVLNVSANQESWGQLSTRVNNYGSVSTGDYRLASQLTLNNPLKLGDQWRVGGTVSDATENWSANAAVDVHKGGKSIYTLSGQYQNMALAQDFELLNMSGWQANGYVGYKMVPLQRLNSTLSWDVNVGYLQQAIRNDSNISYFDIAIQEIPAHIGFEGSWAKSKTYLGYGLKAGAGYFLAYSAPTELDDSYWAAVNPELSLAQSITGGALQQGMDWKTKIQAQYAVNDLPSHRRFSLSGNSKVASYAAGAFTGDTAVFVDSTLTLLNLNLGWFQTVIQGAAQAGWGTTNEIETEVIVSAGGIIDLNIGPLDTQLKVFSNEDFQEYNIWFEVTLNWPKGS
jgi:hemolysin activation/secretion protein